MARQAHTFLLAGFETLLREVVPGVRWAVTNPFANETKGEACRRLGPASRLAVRSASCEYLGRQRATVLSWKRQNPKRAKMFGDGPHCGLCVPCIVRRAALKRANISDHDSLYFASAPLVLAGVRERDSAVAFFGKSKDTPPLMNMLGPNVLYMERHCRWLISASVADFAVQYLPELRGSRVLSGGSPTDVAAIHGLARRYAREILEFLNG